MEKFIRSKKQKILDGKTSLGIEFGSTRIKAILIDEDCEVLASGNHQWENKYIDGNWTYSLESIWDGLQKSYQEVAKNVQEMYGISLQMIGSIGISGMMHGYLALDEQGEMLVPFRTWRNTTTKEAAKKLSELFHFNIPERWSIAYLYQAMLKGEEHISNVHYMTTLAGYLHWKLTGKKVLGIGDASGMFPIDTTTYDYDTTMLNKFEQLIEKHSISWKMKEILPKVLVAGEQAGFLSEEGAKLIDPTGQLQSGIPFCPPEGDAGTGMVATNSVSRRTGNVSAGTSIFSMVVLEQPLKHYYSEVDIVTTPTGDCVAMVHANNCTSDLNAWAEIFKEFAKSIGKPLENYEIYPLLYEKALEGEIDCGGLLSYGYVSGESITGFEKGRPLFVRKAESSFTLANFLKCHLFSAMATLKIGFEILMEKENVKLDKMVGHGGFFKTKKVGQQMMATMFEVPVSIQETASEGGAFGIALLSLYMRKKGKEETLETYLNDVFAKQEETVIIPKQEEIQGFKTFMQRYKKGLEIERVSVEFF